MVSKKILIAPNTSVNLDNIYPQLNIDCKHLDSQL